MKTILISVAYTLLVTASSLAAGSCRISAGCGEAQACDPGYCEHCGCKKCCRVVCETKEVKKTVWAVKCTEFCAPLPGCLRGNSCGCDDRGVENDSGESCAGKCDPCASEYNKRVVPPRCGPVRTKKELVKNEVTCKVPSYKCVVVCPRNCTGDCVGHGAAEPAAPAGTGASPKPDAPKPAPPEPIKAAQLIPMSPATQLLR